MRVLPELVEAAARTGNLHVAADAIGRLAEFTRVGGTDWGLGIGARCRALPTEGEAAGPLYREALGQLGRTRTLPAPTCCTGSGCGGSTGVSTRGSNCAACQMLESIGMPE